MKVTHRGLAKPDDPVYKQGWTSYIGPLQIKPSTTPSSTPPKASETSPKDYILEDLKRRNIPVTRENYVLYNWMGDYDPAEPLPAELEAELPPFLRLNNQPENQSGMGTKVKLEKSQFLDNTSDNLDEGDLKNLDKEIGKAANRRHKEK